MRSAVLHEGGDRAAHRRVVHVFRHRGRIRRPRRVRGPARPHGARELAAAVPRGGHPVDTARDARAGRPAGQAGGDRVVYRTGTRGRY